MRPAHLGAMTSQASTRPRDAQPRPEPRIADVDGVPVRLGEGHRAGEDQPIDAVPLPGIPGVFVDPSPMLAEKIHFAAPHEATLQAYEHGRCIGYIVWGVSRFWGDVHEPSKILTRPGHERRGIATALFREAQRHDPDLEHSEVRTEKGDAWARKTGDPLPKYHFTCEQDRHEFFAEHPEAMDDA